MDDSAYRVKSLVNLENADAKIGHVVWDGPRSVWNTLIFTGAVILPFFHTTWAAIGFGFILTAVTITLGHSIGYHRLMIHQNFSCPKALEYVLIYLGMLVGMGGPLWTRRLRDTRDWAQRQPRCHSFVRHAKSFFVEGFYYLNFKLILDNPPQRDPHDRLEQDRFIRFLERTWMVHQIPVACFAYYVFGMAGIVWAVFVRVALSIFMHWSVSYFAHTGTRTDWIVDGAAIQASNVPILSVFTAGEAWHANHHAFPSSARHGLYPGQFDLGWQFIKILRFLGLASNVKTPDVMPVRPSITPITNRATQILPEDQRTFYQTKTY